jgi:hypothetical protein
MILVPRLCLGTQCIRGSASVKLNGCIFLFHSQAEPGNEVVLNMPQYVILDHETQSGRHFDFMLDMGGVLKTWSLPQPIRPGVEIDAQQLPDHRPAYLDYEGPVSGDRGSVTRWDGGTYNVQRQSESELIVRLTGEKLIGQVSLQRSPAAHNCWRCIFTP